MAPLKNNTILTFLTTENILEGEFANITSKNTLSPPLSNHDLNSDKNPAMAEKGSNNTGICIGGVIAAYIILLIFMRLTYPPKGRTSTEDGTVTMTRFQFYCSRIANFLCCKRKNNRRKLACFSFPLRRKNEGHCAIQIVVEDYDQTVMMQQAKTERETQQKKSKAIQIQIFTVEVECHRTPGLKSENETGLNTIEERQDDEGIGKDEEQGVDLNNSNKKD